MRVAILFIAICCLLGSAIGQVNTFQEPCSSHILKTWPDELRKAAQTDCKFFEEAQQTGADAWEKFATKDAAMNGINGREQIRAKFLEVYAKPGFRLLWFPTKGAVYGTFVVTAGNYERHALDTSGKETLSQGHYLTVWQKQKNGTYLYVWDGGE